MAEVFWRPVSGTWRRAVAHTPEAALQEAVRQRQCTVGECLPAEISVDGETTWLAGSPDAS